MNNMDFYIVQGLSAFNVEEFIRKIKMQGEKPQDKQKVH